MGQSLAETLQILKNHQPELQRRGLIHVAVFGSVVRGEANVDSDIDILIEVDSSRAMGVFAYASLESYINGLLGGSADVVNRKTLKPLLQDAILRDAVHAF